MGKIQSGFVPGWSANVAVPPLTLAPLGPPLEACVPPPEPPEEEPLLPHAATASAATSAAAVARMVLLMPFPFARWTTPPSRAMPGCSRRHPTECSIRGQGERPTAFPRLGSRVAVAASRAAQPAGIYATAVGKKYAMAISGIVLMAFVLAHMVGNLKLYFGAGPLDRYSHWLRTVGEPALPAQGLLYAERAVLLAALVLHVHA